MKQTKLAILLSALVAGTAIGTAASASDSLGTIVLASAPAIVLAKHGRDDRKPEPCDDHGTDICLSDTQILAKHGRDDRKPEPCDDHGTDICLIKA